MRLEEVTVRPKVDHLDEVSATFWRMGDDSIGHEMVDGEEALKDVSMAMARFALAKASGG